MNAVTVKTLTLFPEDSEYLKQGSWRMQEAEKEGAGGWILDVIVHYVGGIRQALCGNENVIDDLNLSADDLEAGEQVSRIYA